MNRKTIVDYVDFAYSLRSYNYSFQLVYMSETNIYILLEDCNLTSDILSGFNSRHRFRVRPVIVDDRPFLKIILLEDVNNDN